MCLGTKDKQTLMRNLPVVCCYLLLFIFNLFLNNGFYFRLQSKEISAEYRIHNTGGNQWLLEMVDIPQVDYLKKFNEPMLAESSKKVPVGEDYSYEVKWDGIRAMAYLDRDGYRVVSRHGRPLTEQFPELAFFNDLAPGTVLDGELVVLWGGKPALGLVQARQQAQAARKIRYLAKATPAFYVAFDLLFDGYRSLMDYPLAGRREALRKAVAGAERKRLVYSEGVVGPGKAFFERVVEKGLEGVVAKRLASRYRPGRRTDAWLKIKPPARGTALADPGLR